MRIKIAMKENLLHFVWKLQLFSPMKLQSTKGEFIQVVASGIENKNTGPDFLNAKIVIGKQLWAGNVEIHINSSDWYAHTHEVDSNYDSVILHVVWEHNVDIYRKSNQKIATLELKNYISKHLLDNYKLLFNRPKKWINCEHNIEVINSFILTHWFERLFFERLEQKSDDIQQLLTSNNNDWEATLFILLAKNFGLKINADAFKNFATSFNFSVVRKVSTNLNQLEALFFGQAGLLANNFESAYFKRLKEEYEYLKIKYKLTSISKEQVQFFRLRPNNFPTVRLSQLASLYFKHKNLFSKIIEVNTVEDFYDLLATATLPFWETHYTFEKESKKSIKKLSKSFIDLVLINTIVPVKFMYLKNIGKSNFSSVISIIDQIKPEKNKITSNFNNLKIKSSNAFETQALLQLKNEYCNHQLCLQCEIGKEVLKI
ncbi:DUF2851 family protein [Lutibacter profundi]|nr:DUF2851 family protein [Lutibacter profundi]